MDSIVGCIKCELSAAAAAGGGGGDSSRYECLYKASQATDEQRRESGKRGQRESGDEKRTKKGTIVPQHAEVDHQRLISAQSEASEGGRERGRPLILADTPSIWVWIEKLNR